MSTEATQATGVRALSKVCRTSPDWLNLVYTLVPPLITSTPGGQNTRVFPVTHVVLYL